MKPFANVSTFLPCTELPYSVAVGKRDTVSDSPAPLRIDYTWMHKIKFYKLFIQSFDVGCQKNWKKP